MPNMVSNAPYAQVPDWFRNWGSTGLITFEDKNGDGRIQCTGPTSHVENELTIDRDIMVPANPEIARLPDCVIGLVAAGVAVCVAGHFGINPPGFVAQVVAFALSASTDGGVCCPGALAPSACCSTSSSPGPSPS